jgi:hypothetical protein
LICGAIEAGDKSGEELLRDFEQIVVRRFYTIKHAPLKKVALIHKMLVKILVIPLGELPGVPVTRCPKI